MSKPDVEVSIWIMRSPEDIWKYLYDVSNEPRWREGVISAQWISKPPLGIGSNGLHVVKGIGDWLWTMVEWEEPYIMSWDATADIFKGARAGYRIAPEDDGSRMTIHISMKRSALMIILIPIIKRLLRRQLAGDLERLKAIMEA